VPLLRLERDRAIPTPVQAMFMLEDHGGASHAAALFAGLPRAQREWLEQALNDALGPHGEALRSRLQAGLPEETGALLSAGLRAVHQQRQAATQAHATRVRHVLCDHLGTPIALVDANGPQAGLVTWAATYHAWGALREAYDPHGIGQDIRFQGQQFDVETGSHYNRFRYYDPMLGQYVTQDPMGLEGGMNKHSYPVNPNGFIDPLGLRVAGMGAISTRPQPRLPARVEAHNSELSADRQLRREFPFDDPFSPIYGVKNDRQKCRTVCFDEGLVCRPRPEKALPNPGRPGCYEVCDDGPFFEPSNPDRAEKPVSTHGTRKASKGDWMGLGKILRIK